MKKFILNADDFAKSEFHNRAVIEGLKKGTLKSASIMVNMPSYNDEVKNIIKQFPTCRFGVHLNIMEGKAFNNIPSLCDKEGNFNNSYLSLIIKSHSKKFLNDLEKEFRSQIEFALKDFKPSHIDSHVHTHGIPEIFKLTLKLAKEYNIPYIRTQAEIPYFINDKNYNLKTYLINFIKIILLNYFTIQNIKLLKTSNIKTNDFLLGIGYSSMMNSKAILEGLKKINKNSTTEALFHPAVNSKEFEIIENEKLFDLIKDLGFEIV